MNNLLLLWLLFRVESILEDYCHIYCFGDFISIVDNIDFSRNSNKINVMRFQNSSFKFLGEFKVLHLLSIVSEQHVILWTFKVND